MVFVILLVSLGIGLGTMFTVWTWEVWQEYGIGERMAAYRSRRKAARMSIGKRVLLTGIVNYSRVDQ